MSDIRALGFDDDDQNVQNDEDYLEATGHALVRVVSLRVYELWDQENTLVKKEEKYVSVMTKSILPIWTPLQ